MAKDDPTFDPSGGEPDPGLNTIYRSISIENNAVRICLINEARIEASVLVEDRNEGNELMYRNPRNVNRCYSIDAFQLGGSYVILVSTRELDRDLTDACAGVCVNKRLPLDNGKAIPDLVLTKVLTSRRSPSLSEQWTPADLPSASACQTALNDARARWDSAKQQRAAAEAEARRLNAEKGAANVREASHMQAPP